MHKKALKAIVRLSHVDPTTAIQMRRHNPILDSEFHIEEELINLQESLDSFYAAGETSHHYPQMYEYIAREKRQILQHCVGLIIRMIHGRNLPRPYTRSDIDASMQRLVQLIVEEARRAGKRLDEDVLRIFRPYLTVRQRLSLHDYGFDLVLQAVQYYRALSLITRRPMLAVR